METEMGEVKEAKVSIGYGDAGVGEGRKAVGMDKKVCLEKWDRNKKATWIKIRKWEEMRDRVGRICESA